MDMAGNSKRLSWNYATSIQAFITIIPADKARFGETGRRNDGCWA
jgi:hypothetical protein